MLSCAVDPSASSMFLDWERTIKILGVESNFEVALVPVELSAV